MGLEVHLCLSPSQFFKQVFLPFMLKEIFICPLPLALTEPSIINTMLRVHFYDIYEDLSTIYPLMFACWQTEVVSPPGIYRNCFLDQDNKDHSSLHRKYQKGLVSGFFVTLRGRYSLGTTQTHCMWVILWALITTAMGLWEGLEIKSRQT